jgi:hypothetical protein
MTRCYPKEHDILKICGKFKGEKVHYCPHAIGRVDRDLLARLKGYGCYRFLGHHCVFRWDSKKHHCDQNEFFPITRNEFFLALADVKASVISRKLNVGYRKTKATIWDVYHLWKNKTINDCRGTEPNDQTLVPELAYTGDLPTTFKNREKQVTQRSEDAWKCPFASLMTHSELTEKWFKFFMKNHDYFNVPAEIKTLAKARDLSSRIQGNRSSKNPKEGLPITFVRLKLFANQSLSRIADTEIIQSIGRIVKSIPEYFSGGQELYTLYDEVILVMPTPATDINAFIEDTLKNVEGFTTNYYFEGNYSRPATRLFNKDLLLGYDDLFTEFRQTYYPPLKSSIDPDYTGLAEHAEEAFHAKLCELCNMAEAEKTFWKFNREETGIHECLCINCHSIRVKQEAVNKTVENGEETQHDIRHGIGYKIAKWETSIPQSKLCFLKIDLDLGILSTVLKSTLIDEFPLPKFKEHYNDEHIGFSILYEFLKQYEEFLRNFNDGIRSLPKFDPKRIDERSNVSNEFQILENLVCLRMDDISEVKDVLNQFAESYRRAFPEFRSRDQNKNKNFYPITFSLTISNIKFPFFEAWRYLNNPKTKWMNILVTRSFELSINPNEYEELTKINFRQNEIIRFLHKLSSINERTRSELLVNTEIFNNQRDQEKIFRGIMRGAYGGDDSLHNLLCFYKLMKEVK